MGQAVRSRGRGGNGARRGIAGLIVAGAVALAGPPGRAAEIAVVPERAGALRAVTVDGAIARGDARAFERTVLRAKAATVVLDGIGGDVGEALAIARTVRERGFRTVVPAGATCSGACVVIWLAGTTRSLHQRGVVRFHLVTVSGASAVDTAWPVDLVTLERAIHVEFGHPVDLAWELTRSPPASARRLTPEVARELRLEVVWLSGTDRREPVAAPPLPPGARTAAAKAAAKEAAVFVGDLMRWIRLDRPLTDGIIRQFYAPRIAYHGADLSRHDLKMRQRRYRRRTPGERIVPVAEPVASCGPQGRRCRVEVKANLHGKRDQWGRTADAVLLYRFAVERRGPRMHIVAQDTEVLSTDAWPEAPDDRKLVARIQAELDRLLCRPGPVDGVWGEKTAGALARFHRANGTRHRTDGPTRHDLRLMEATPAPIC